MPVKTNPLPPLLLLTEILYIDELSPSGLRWKRDRGGKAKAGSIAGTKEKTGYWLVGIKTDKNKRYLCHRIIYYMKTGIDPVGKFIDHIDGNCSDNTQIRICEFAENTRNKKKFNKNKNSQYSSLFKGVCWDKSTKKWMAQITVNYVKKKLGRYKTEEEAAMAYNKAASEYFGEFAVLNKLPFSSFF